MESPINLDRTVAMRLRGHVKMEFSGMELVDLFNCLELAGDAWLLIERHSTEMPLSTDPSISLRRAVNNAMIEQQRKEEEIQKTVGHPNPRSIR